MGIRNYVEEGLATLALAGSLLFSGCSDRLSQPRKLEERIGQEIAQQNGKHDKYALLITSFDEKRFIHELESIYDVLLKSGFRKEDIYILGPDKVSYRGKPHEISCPIDDIATRKTIETVFSHLEKKIDEHDLLVVHISGHGDKIVAKVENVNSPETYQKITRVVMLWEDDVILENEGNVTELEFERYLSKLRLKFGIVTSDLCFGGEIAERVGKNRIIGISASKKDEESHSLVGDSFGGYFYQAFINPRGSDGNKGGSVTVDEAFDYAKSKHSWTRSGEDTPLLISDIDASKVTIK